MCGAALLEEGVNWRPSNAKKKIYSCDQCSQARGRTRNIIENKVRLLAYKIGGGLSQEKWLDLPREQRFILRRLAEKQLGLSGPRQPVVDSVPASSRPSVPRRSRIHSLPRLAHEPRRLSRRRRISINRRAAHGPGFLYAMYDEAIHAARCEIKLGLTTNLDRRLGQAHNLGDFKYLAFVPVSDMRNAEAWLMRTYANECIENERFRIESFGEVRAMLSLAAVVFKVDRDLFVGLDSHHPEVTASGR